MPVPRHARRAFLVILVAVALLLPTAPLDPAPVLAGEPPAAIRCPERVGGMRHRPSSVGTTETSLQCFYSARRIGDGALRLIVRWRPDVPADRRPCTERDPRPVDGQAGGPEDVNRRIDHPERGATGTYHVTEGRRITRAQAEKALLRMLEAAAPYAHPCIPEDEPVEDGAPVCPLVIGDAYVRQDWYGGDVPAIAEIGAPADRRFDLECRYRPGYTEDGDAGSLRVAWSEGPNDADRSSPFCRVEDRDDGYATTVQDGRAPVQGRITDTLLAAGGRPVLDRLMASVASRTSPCPGSSASTPPSAPAASPSPVSAAPPRLTSVVLTGGPGDPRPSAGDRVGLPADDQYELIVSGPDGTEIREGFIGTDGTITGIGAVVEDADGGWAILVTIAVDPPVATATPPATPGARPTRSPVPVTAPPTVTATPSVAPATTPPLPSPPPAPTRVPATPPAPAPTASASPASDPAAEAAIAAIAAQVERLADAAVTSGDASVRIPAGDLDALVALAPDVASRVRPTSGTIVVTTTLGEIMVTPDIDPATGLLEFHLSRFAWARTLPVVQQLIGALNRGVSGRGVRFRQVQVTPDGIELRAVHPR